MPTIKREKLRSRDLIMCWRDANRAPFLDFLKGELFVKTVGITNVHHIGGSDMWVKCIVMSPIDRIQQK